MTPRINDPRRYSGRGEARDAEGLAGEAVPGTAGAQDDINRYRGAAWNPTHQNAVQIDQTRSNEARALGGGALGMLRARAEGAETPAQRLAREQTQGAVAGVQSGAASIKGGAGARAAAARGAMGSAQRVAAMGTQDMQALRAREMADAAGQYFGGASAQRGQDLTLAGDQARLEAAHRAAQDQREQYYEQAAFDVGNADNLGRLGASAQDVNAASAAYKQGIQGAAASREFGDRMVGTVVGGVVGGATAYGMTRPTAPGAPPGAPPAQPRPGLRPDDDLDPYGGIGR